MAQSWGGTSPRPHTKQSGRHEHGAETTGMVLLQKGFHVGDFRKMKKFNQTPYKLPPPTPIHVPAEKRPLEEKAL
ncbi:hypothetical protein TNCV_2715391 [Trichonephila clavipes]|nr:hypothetical protein TNCV_2715391 [Trichonephila clavipes]